MQCGYAFSNRNLEIYTEQTIPSQVTDKEELSNAQRP